MLKIEAHILQEAFQTNTWLIYDDENLDGILIDPGAPSQSLLQRIQTLKLNVSYIINTHGHADHIGGNEYFRIALGCPLAIHELDAVMLTNNQKNLSVYLDGGLKNQAADVLLQDGQILSFAGKSLQVIHTPGHTRGGICLLVEKYLISGDTLFEASIGRTDFPGGDHATLIKSIKEKLFVLPDDVLVYPGHGPRTTIGIEKKTNPFVR